MARDDDLPTEPTLGADPTRRNRRRSVVGTLVEVSPTQRSNRNLGIELFESRALVLSSIHELIVTNQPAERGSTVAEVAYLGFFEVTSGGVVCAEDTLVIDGMAIGTLVGFNLTHMPNHLNLVIRVAEMVTGAALGLDLGASVVMGSARRATLASQMGVGLASDIAR